MKRIKVYMKIENEKIVCLCLKARKRCKDRCETDEVFYDQFKGWQSCVKNIKGVPK